jgi:hypothetical protein
MDYGYPQFTEAPILQEFIKTDSYRMEVRKQHAGSAAAVVATGWCCRESSWLGQRTVAFVLQAQAW